MAVHRFKANEMGDNEKVVEAKKTKAKVAVKSSKKDKPEKKQRKVFAPLRALGGYFSGSWRELRAVRWPNRKQTWALTLAVILFSLALGVLIFLLDAGFTLLFKKFIF